MPHSTWPKDGQPWKVACFGTLRRNPAIPSEPTIELHLTRQDVNKAFSQSNEASKEKPEDWAGLQVSIRKDLKKSFASPSETLTRAVQVGVGMLPAYELGSVYIDEKLSPAGLSESFDGIVEFDQKKIKYVSAWDKMNALRSDLNGDRPIISPYKLYIPKKAGNAPFLALPVINGRHHYILVPGAEIARTWFMRSTELAHVFISDAIDEAARQLLKAMPDKDGQHQYKPLVPLSPEELLIAYAAWHSQLFRTQANEIFARFAACNMRSQDYYLRPFPPVIGNARVTAFGVTNSDITTGVRIFIVNRLVLVPKPTLDLPWEKLGVVRDRGLGSSSEASNVVPRRRFGPGKPRSPTDASKVGHEDEPNKGLDEDVFEPHLAGFADMPVISESIAYERDPIKGAYRAPVAGGESSSGKGKGSGNVTPARVRARPNKASEDAEHSRPPALPADFASIVKAMEIFRDKWKGSYRNLGDAGGFDGTAIASLEFPVVVDGQPVAWSYFDETRPRRYLAIEFKRNGRHAYLFDIQHRDKGVGRSEHYTMLVVARANFEPIDINEIRALIVELCVSREGRWSRRSSTGVYSEQWKHTFSDPEQLAARIYGLIAKDPELLTSVTQKTIEA